VSGQRRAFVTAGFATLIATGALAAGLATSSPTTTVSGCSMEIQPLNPFQQTCGIPNDPPVVRGAAPSAGAIIGCRHDPGCLSYVVNGGPGYGGLPRPDTTVQHSP
jgi:hypothetical protein